MEFTHEQLDSVVSISCSACGQKFRMNEEVKQIIIGRLSWIKDIDDDGREEWVLAIGKGEIADVHVKCVSIN
jgi:hypothetical protein